MSGDISTCCTTNGLIAMARDARRHNRNRQVTEKFLHDLDPNGVHICALNFPHNDVEMRGRWFCKMRGEMEPVTAFVDCSFEVWNRNTSEVDFSDPDNPRVLEREA